MMFCLDWDSTESLLAYNPQIFSYKAWKRWLSCRACISSDVIFSSRLAFSVRKRTSSRFPGEIAWDLSACSWAAISYYKDTFSDPPASCHKQWDTYRAYRVSASHRLFALFSALPHQHLFPPDQIRHRCWCRKRLPAVWPEKLSLIHIWRCRRRG